MSTLVNRGPFALVLVLGLGASTGCTPAPSKGGVVSLKDMHANGEADGGDAGEIDADGGGGDMATAGGRHWTDESSPGVDGGNLWSAFNDGNGTVVVAGDYGRILRSSNE